MKLYFENSYRERRLIGEPKDSNESWKIMNDFCEERNFKVYYIRSWRTSNGEKHYDVGSHTEFFIEVDDDDNIRSNE